MINAVRLRPADTRKGFELSTYVSAATCSRYTAGTPNMPATLHVVDNAAELAELSEIPQFQIVTVKDMEALKSMVQREMEDRARSGLPAVHAYVQKAPAPPVTDADKPKGAAKPSLGQVLRKKASETEAAEAEADTEGKAPTDHEDGDPDATEGEDTPADDKAQAAAQAPQGNSGRRGKGK
ncbi:MAG: hypothetical protein M0R37_15145 [Bacteroidales bacterium]|jgi:hypothetical protein|nr:hypothetical protein [Bacteroidales bacterium]